MHTQPNYLGLDAGLTAIFLDDVLIDGTGFPMLPQRACAVVFRTGPMGWGSLLERWFLKTLINLSFNGGWS
jgi:hypothetical protein